MDSYFLRIQLKSDAAFGRGEGVAGLVDQEVEHDATGLPFIRGRTLKGLLVEEAANILYALEKHPNFTLAPAYRQAATEMFGRPGSTEAGTAALRVGDAQLPQTLRLALQQEVAEKRLTPAQLLAALTDIRRQTAMDESGKPEPHSLRSIRVILRETVFLARLDFYRPVADMTRATRLLAATVKAFRRGGTGRNRGTGRLVASLWNEAGQDITDEPLFKEFAQEVSGS